MKARYIILWLFFSLTAIVGAKGYGAAPQRLPPAFEMGALGLMKPLSRFSPKLADVEAALRQKQLQKARALAEERLRDAPEDFAAYVAFLQASYGSLGPLYQESLARVSTSNRPSDQAKHGAVCFYYWDEQYRTGEWSRLKAGKSLIERAVSFLSVAWHGGKDPLVGILYLEAAPYAQSVTPVVEVCEGILRREVGAAAFEEYRKCKARGWVGSLTIPQLDRARLPVVVFALNKIEATLAREVRRARVRVVHGQEQTVMETVPLTSEQQRLRRVLDDWQRGMERGADGK